MKIILIIYLIITAANIMFGLLYATVIKQRLQEKNIELPKQTKLITIFGGLRAFLGSATPILNVLLLITYIFGYDTIINTTMKSVEEKINNTSPQ